MVLSFSLFFSVSQQLLSYITPVQHRQSTLAMARLLPLVAAAALLGPAASTITSRRECVEVEGDFYQFSAKTLNGSDTIAFEEYRGKVGPVPQDCATLCLFDISLFLLASPYSFHSVNNFVLFLGSNGGQRGHLLRAHHSLIQPNECTGGVLC